MSELVGVRVTYWDRIPVQRSACLQQRNRDPRRGLDILISFLLQEFILKHKHARSLQSIDPITEIDMSLNIDITVNEFLQDD